MTNQEGNPPSGLPGQGGEIAKETFVAGVEQVIESETPADNELFEAKLQTEQAVGKPVSQPFAKQPTPVPAAPKSPPSIPTKTPTSLEPLPTPEPTAPPTPTPEPTPVPPPVPAPKPAGKININTAGSVELEQLNGIGPVLAGKIIDYRTNMSLFYAIEDIKNVSGIGEAIFEKIKNDITVGNVSPAPQPPAPQPEPSPPPSGKININTASFEELQHITGVGEVIAQRIIDYRIQNGPFLVIDDLKNVSGIGDKTFEKMKDEIAV